MRHKGILSSESMSSKFGPFEIKTKRGSYSVSNADSVVSEFVTAGVTPAGNALAKLKPNSSSRPIPAMRLEAPFRQYDCESYDSCLSVAAALNWNSFTCENCSGCPNQQLLWKAHSKLRDDNPLAKLCALPKLK